MSAIPSARERVQDFGLNISSPASMMALVIGVSSGPLAENVVTIFSDQTSLREQAGEGPGVEAGAEILSQGGAPIAFVRTQTTIPATIGPVQATFSGDGTLSAVTKSGAGPTITVAGNPSGAYVFRIEITTAGVLGTSRFRWSIDGGTTWAASALPTPVGNTHLLDAPGVTTGITATFPAGSYVLSEHYDWTSTAGGGGVTVTGTANLDALVRVEIMTSGELGVARFRYSLDGYTGDSAAERTYSETLYVPAGGTFQIPGLGITLTFDDATNDFVAGDFYVCEVEAAASNSTNVAAAFAAITASPTRWRFCLLVTSKGNGNAVAHAILGAALQSHLNTLANTSKYRRGMMASTHEDTAASVVAAWDDVIAIRCLIAHGQVRRTTVKPFSGYAFPVTNAADVFAARAARSLPSTDLKRVRSGPIEEVVKLFHDEYRTPSNLDDIKVSTLRTFENFEGIYVTQGRLKSPDGSDFRYWPLGIVMDIACETVNAGLTREIGRGVRYASVTVDSHTYVGTIDDRDATVIEESVSQDLIAQLLAPINAEGFEGHITDIRYRISRTHNFQATGVVIGQVGILPLGYIDYLETTIGFVVSLPNGG
jgi:hypothetical protein